MKRAEILQRLGYTVPECKKKRVIVVSDIHCEADDPFAIMHHLLTPSFDVRGVIACHYELAGKFGEQAIQLHPEWKEKIESSASFVPRGTSREASYEEGVRILQLAGIDDIPLLRGAQFELNGTENLPESEGADFIIREALSEDPRPLYVCMQGGETDLAIAYLKKPEIAGKITAVGIMGGAYPGGAWEYNCAQDVEAVNVLLSSPMEYWQIPSNVYAATEVSFAELIREIRPCGDIGNWMVEQMLDFQKKTAHAEQEFPNAEVWCIGDNPTVGVLLQSSALKCWHMEKAPRIGAQCEYLPNMSGKEIRVYDRTDSRLTVHDLIAKMQLCYCPNQSFVSLSPEEK